MYKAVVVDDEKWIVEGIKSGVHWNSFGFEVIADAENGQEALELVKALRPDVVLTDIKMPVLGGLELIKKGKEASPDTLFVVLSAHAEFAYAQKALNYGTFGYCLKPFEIEEIDSMLARLAEVLNTRKRESFPAHIPDLYEAICSGDMDQVKRVLQQTGTSIDNARQILPIVVQSSKAAGLQQPSQHLSFQMSPRRFGYLVHEHAAEALLEDLSRAHQGSMYSIGAGFLLSDLAELNASLEAASLASYGSFTTGQPGMFNPPPQTNPYIEETLKMISDALGRKDRVQFMSCMKTAKTHFSEGKFSMKDAYLIFTAIIYHFFRTGAQGSGRMFEGYEELSYHFGHAGAMIDYLVEHTLSDLDNPSYAIRSDISHKTIREILRYIHDHFTDDLSIQGLSEKFFLSPNYLCHLFKKEVGENFIEYVSNQRIQYACKLLAETNDPIKQIGDKCGFNDYFYFTRIFKRITNMTPTQYRERQNL
ncbi:response regulator [Paenibacillus sp. HJL G12]|uniref:Response regulator n=1 Tax=Paenibacillus dendrobii TaxID=2691084 RepID=A0A7X3LKH3_9BACL|nr:helix-turn-helix domain-containing protein [Paenibacillus dendrobii]MWV47255.1 response regulator [Paenibacillus dendrobii]